MRKQSALWSCFVALGLFCCLSLITFTLSGCSSGGTTTGGTTTTVTGVVVSPATATVTAGQTTTFTCAVSGQGNPSQVCSWSVSPTSAGTITASGASATFTASSSITSATKVTITANSTVQDYTQKYGTATVTVNPVPVTVTSVTVNPATATVPAGQTATFTADVSGTGAYSSAVTWSVSPASAGTITADGVFTASSSITATTNATITATSAASGYTNIKGTAAVTVNPPPLPDVTSIFPPTVYLEEETIVLSGPEIVGTNFAPTDYLYDPTGNLQLADYVDSSHIKFGMKFDSLTFSPGQIPVSVCTDAEATHCGTSQSIAFFGGGNYLGVSSSGEHFFLDQAQGAPDGQNGFVRKYKPDGTADGSCQVGFDHSIAVDNKTPYMLIDGYVYNFTGQNIGTANGGSCDYSDVPNPQGMPSGEVVAVAADNGYAGFVQPANGSASFYDMTGGTDSQPTVHTASNLGNHPGAIAMGTLGGETDADVLSLDGTVSLYNIRVMDASQNGLALPIPGCSSLSAIRAANPLAGGWQVLMFDSGPASGTDVVFCAADQLLVFVDHGTWTIGKSVALSGISGIPSSDVPFRVARDLADGTVIVAYVVPQAATTVFASVDVATGTVTPLTGTYDKLAVGLLVGADGKTI